MQWDAYVKLFDFLFYYIVISIFIAIQSASLETIFSLINLGLASMSFLALIVAGGVFTKKYVFYSRLHKRTDWFEKYPSLFDGLKFNLKRVKIYLVFPFLIKTMYAAVLIFFHESPFYQITLCALVRLINIAAILVTRPFHFNFIQRRDIASEVFLILMIAMCLNCTDDNSESV